MKLFSFIPIALLSAVILVSGCTTQQTGTTTQTGDKLLEDGTIVKPDGTMVKPDGTIVKPDGTMIYPNGTMIESESMDKPVSSGSTMEYNGQVIAGTTAPLLDFKKADYDKALQTDDLIVLYFYADWCPICRAEVPHLYGAFNDLNTDKVTGFRVNFNDGATDQDEMNLARQFGVPYQHTKVFLKNGQQILKSPETWDKSRYLTEINNAIS